MRGTRALRKVVAAVERSARGISPVLVLAVLLLAGTRDICRADGRVSGTTADLQQQRQYAQVPGYVGDAPPQAVDVPPAAPEEPAKAPKHTSKEHEKSVGYVKVGDDEKIKLDFKSVSKALDLDKHEGEKSDIREHWRALKGAHVEWSGNVYRVSTGWRGYKIQLMNDSVKTDEKYNIVLTGRDREDAKDIDDDDELWFEGVISDYRVGQGERGPIITLKEGEIKKKKSR